MLRTGATALFLAPSLCLAGTLLFSDDLTGRPAGGDGAPLWTIASGQWQMTEDGFHGTDCGGHFVATGARTGRAEWTDYVLTLSFKMLSRGSDWRDGPWIGFRSQDDRNAYTLGFYSRLTALHKTSRGIATGDEKELATSSSAVTDSDWHDVRISVRGQQIEIDLDGAPLLHVKDEDWNSSPWVMNGGIVLSARKYSGSEGSTTVLFRNVRIEAIGPAPDSMRYTLADAVRERKPATGLLQFLGERRERRWPNVPRKVLAFYYTWYGRPERHGRWVHWAEVDPEAHDIASSTHYPAKGAYDSHDPAIIDHHISLAMSAGLDGFICTWWGPRSFDDRAFRLVLEHAEKHTFSVTVYWETVPLKGRAQINKAVDDLLYLLREYGSHPAFLKVQGKPVIFVYGRIMGQVPFAAWPEIITETRKQSGQDFLLLADGYRSTYARLFDGIHTYNICGWVRDQTREELRTLSASSFSAAVATARSKGRLSCLTIIPGYDDTKIRTPGINAQRLGGDTYRILWEEAIKADPDWVLITSWNEWHEGSEIEPSWEDGDLYVRLTGQYAPRFKRTPHSTAKVASSLSGLPPEDAEKLRTLFRDRKLGLLPDYTNEAVFLLADAGLSLCELSWEDVLNPAVLDPAEVPVLLYAGGERYTQSLQRDSDVDDAMLRYLRGGGLVLAFSPQPFPFYYNEKGEAVVAARTFGIPIAGSGAFGRQDTVGTDAVKGWESPPPGVKLRFRVETDELSGLPKTTPFPTSGDLRWRPCTPAGVAPGDLYVPLARLVDTDGTHYGDGIAYIEYRESEPKGGKAVYVWMRMGDVLGNGKLLASVLQFVASKL